MKIFAERQFRRWRDRWAERAPHPKHPSIAASIARDS